MSMRTRVLIFSTFFGNLIAIGLLLASLTTNNWVCAILRRGTSLESKGAINYGLFYGTKDLNPGVGQRITQIFMIDFVQNENVMSYWLWLFTTLGTGLGLLSSAVAAIISVLKSASSEKNHKMMWLVLSSNIFAASSQIFAVICWIIQFYEHFTHNVLTLEDQMNWSSQGSAYMGYSFYLVIVSTFVIILNISIIIYAKRIENRQRFNIEIPIEEKNQGDIMLY